MPGLRSVLQDPSILDDSSDILAEKVRLYLPSELSSSDRDRACLPELTAIEARIRHASAAEALDDLRRNLRTRTYLNKWRQKNISGQRRSTRARSLQHGIDVRVHDAKTRYRHARKALMVVEGPGEWEMTLKELHDDDVRALNERAMTEFEKAGREQRLAAGMQTDDDVREGVVLTGLLGDGTRKLSWIWLTINTADDSKEMHEGAPCFLSYHSRY